MSETEIVKILITALGEHTGFKPTHDIKKALKHLNERDLLSSTAIETIEDYIKETAH